MARGVPRGSLRLSLPMLGRARAWECGRGMTSSCCFWAFMAVYALTTLPNATTWQTGHDLFLIQSFHQHSDLLGHWLHLERHIVEGKGLNFGASPENLPFVLVAFHSLQEESSAAAAEATQGFDATGSLSQIQFGHRLGQAWVQKSPRHACLGRTLWLSSRRPPPSRLPIPSPGSPSRKSSSFMTASTCWKAHLLSPQSPQQEHPLA